MVHTDQIHIRNTLEPGDLGYLIALHGVLYKKEYGFDSTFETYVAIPMAEFARRNDPGEKIWIVEKDALIHGSAGVVKYSDDTAQLRWMLLHPGIRGVGIGNRLMEETIAFAREYRYKRMILWTVDLLKAAAHLYRKYGFSITEEKRHRIWGVELNEQTYERIL